MKKKLKMFLAGISPEFTTRLMYYYNFGKVLNLRNPKGINEKLQYLKLKDYYENPIVTQCVDKYRVREWLAELGYSNLSAQLIAVHDTVEEFRKCWDSYPNKMVIKCNHGCGYNIIVNNKAEMDVERITAQLSAWMQEDYWKVYCEPQYKDVKKKIIVEEHLGEDIHTYKFYCFHGEPKVMYVSSNGENGEYDMYYDYYDMQWNHLPIRLDTHLNLGGGIAA